MASSSILPPRPFLSPPLLANTPSTYPAAESGIAQNPAGVRPPWNLYIFAATSGLVRCYLLFEPRSRAFISMTNRYMQHDRFRLLFTISCVFKPCLLTFHPRTSPTTYRPPRSPIRGMALTRLFSSATWHLSRATQTLKSTMPSA
ncbi:hypothetical protein NLG97_g8580 [Lecanicillium saksenae]|uniref:Uncharacterized protein n=1 Tax=Lecanicillium saksenae TaxID=468837 RepID=A0ACC1QLI5_9HYPO|nr:hypothetical protein NLG97_g8580 [Lecanicillium saksenae]